jgi:hypothetical protein
VEANLDDLRDAVAAHALQFGVAFDGDGDRIGVVDSVGRVIWGDQLMMIFAEDVLQARPGAAIVADVKASNHLFAHPRAGRTGPYVEDRPQPDQIPHGRDRRAAGRRDDGAYLLCR